MNSFERDAPNSVISTVGAAMEEAGYQIWYVAWSRGGPMQSELSANGACAVVINKGLIRGAFALARVVRDFRPHIVHASLARPTIGVALTKMMAGKRQTSWISSDHGVHEWHEKGAVRGALMELLMPAMLTTMDALITVSESAARELIRRGQPAAGVHVVLNGIDARRFYPRAKADRIKFLNDYFPADADHTKTFLIGSAGNLRKLKGFDILIRALAIVLAEYPSIRLVIWGEGPEARALESEASALSVDHAVRFCGYEPLLENWLPLLDLYAQPSRVESFGMAAAEAMACGIPVVVSDAGGLPLLVRNGNSGLVFPVDDVETLAKEIMFIIQNKRQRMTIANAGRLRVLQYYNKQKMVKHMQRLYEKLLSESGVL